jgi:hypothetical protein
MNSFPRAWTRRLGAYAVLVAGALAACSPRAPSSNAHDAGSPDGGVAAQGSVIFSGLDAGRYAWLDTDNLLPPDVTKIQVTDTDGWHAHVVGTAGSVAADRPVLVTCLDLPSMALTRSGAQGEFSVDVLAPPGCTLQVKHDPKDRFLTSALLLDSRPETLNVPPGTWVRHSPPSSATQVKIVGRVANDLDPYAAETMVPYRLTGTVNTVQLSPGATVSITGEVRVLMPSGSTVPSTNATVSVFLTPLTNAQGHWVGGNQKFGSVLRTPVGTPIERWQTGGISFWAEDILSLAASGDERVGTYSLSQALPSDLEPGLYRLSFGVSWGGATWATAPSAAPHWAMYTYDPETTLGPTLRVGSPATPRLPFALFMDVPHNGVRGIADPAQAYKTGLRIGDAASFGVLPRLDAAGQPRVYRLEPVLPFLSYADRGVPRSPFVDLDLPSGQLTATVTRNGTSIVLGPSPFQQTRSSSPSTTTGRVLDRGGGNLGDAVELTTRDPAFRYVFPEDGSYSVRLQGTVRDRSGMDWALDGTFALEVAEPLDLEPPVLPGYPFRVGEQLPIAVQVNPSFPAEVTVRVTYSPNSGIATTQTFTGTANRFGYFNGGESFVFSAPGEYAVELSAKYTDGTHAYAGVMAWSSVVAEASPQISLHGRRGIDASIQPTRDRFTRAQTGIPIGGTHMNFPYLSGDVLMQTDNDAAQVRACFADSSGTLASLLSSHPDADLGVEGGTLAARASANEIPFISKTSNGLDVSLSPGQADVLAYYYAAVNRPGERVRAGVTEDNTDTFYWRFGETYGGQPGMGAEGDRPMDIKFQYLGGVVRTAAHNHYARYASLWVQLPDNDTAGSRTVAPLSEPLMTADGWPISMFVLPTLVKPGTVLEAGQHFTFAAQVGPPVPAVLHVSLFDPAGNLLQTWDRPTNEMGGLTDRSIQRTLETPGLYKVHVVVSSGAVSGGIFQETDFTLPVVSPSSERLPTSLPRTGVVAGLTPLQAQVQGAPGTLATSLLTVPGWIVAAKSTHLETGPTTFSLDAKALQTHFPLIDTYEPAGDVPGLADEFVWVLTAGEGAQLQAERVVLFGPEVWAP